MLSSSDKALLDELQFRFPLAVRPYRVVAPRLGLSEREVVARLARLKKKGIVRYTGVVFDLRRLRFSSKLVALSLPRTRAARAARIINRYPQVSHNYLRTGRYPLWFTVSDPSRARLRRVLEEIRRASGARAMLELPTEKVFKARALFRLVRKTL